LQLNRNNPEWMALAHERRAEALAAMETLIEANLAWTGFDHRLRATHAAASGKAGWSLRWSGRHDASASTNALVARLMTEL
jgi:hypothetical protein